MILKILLTKITKRFTCYLKIFVFLANMIELLISLYDISVKCSFDACTWTVPLSFPYVDKTLWFLIGIVGELSFMTERTYVCQQSPNIPWLKKHRLKITSFGQNVAYGTDL